MPFSFGGSKQVAQSSGSASSFDVAASGSVSGGESVSGSGSQQRVAFEDVFARLFGGAEGAAAGLDPSLLSGAADQLFSGGLDFLDQLSEGGPGTDFLQGRVSGEGGVVDEQIGLLGEDIGKFFNEQLLPGITSEAVQAGSLGGSRQGVAEAGAIESSARAFSSGAAAIRSEDVGARDRAAGLLADQQTQRAGAGLSQLGAVAGIADLGFGADLQPFERLASILGTPTVLGESSSFSSAEDFARAFSQSFGGSQSETQSSSEGKSISFGLS